MLKKRNKKLRLIVSYADSTQGHHGGIYQASNWIFAGETGSYDIFEDDRGKIIHSRMIAKTGITKVFGRYRKVKKPDEVTRIPQGKKYRYLKPLDDDMLKSINHLSKPYPKRPKQAMAGTTSTAAG